MAEGEGAGGSGSVGVSADGGAFCFSSAGAGGSCGFWGSDGLDGGSDHGAGSASEGDLWGVRSVDRVEAEPAVVPAGCGG